MRKARYSTCTRCRNAHAATWYNANVISGGRCRKVYGCVFCRWRQAVWGVNRSTKRQCQRQTKVAKNASNTTAVMRWQSNVHVHTHHHYNLSCLVLPIVLFCSRSCLFVLSSVLSHALSTLALFLGNTQSSPTIIIIRGIGIQRAEE